MSNMSYCRFENTLTDLIDCRNAIEENGGGGALLQRFYNTLNENEKKAFKGLVRCCETISERYSDELKHLVEGEQNPED